MKIGIVSDTHSGFSKNTHKILQRFFMEMEDLDVLVHCGDWISHKQKSFPTIFQVVRSRFPSIPVLGVCGNHDYWDRDGRLKSVEALSQNREEYWKRYNIHYLHDSSFSLGDVTFFGYDGFYNVIPPLTNDANFFPKGASWVDLKERSHNRAAEVAAEASLVKGTRICITHFPLYPQHDMSGSPFLLYNLMPSFDIICWGHSHQEQDLMLENTRIINPGGDYDAPKSKIILV